MVWRGARDEDDDDVSVTATALEAAAEEGFSTDFSGRRKMLIYVPRTRNISWCFDECPPSETSFRRSPVGLFKDCKSALLGFHQDFCHAARCEIFTTVVDSASDSLESL